MVAVDVSSGPRCPHTVTFDCHGTPRCEACHVDMEKSRVLKVDDTGRRRWVDELVWPSQEHPRMWTPQRIADWFHDGFMGLSQGCDGFTFCRNNRMPEGAVYGYVWVETTLDLDMDMAYMLDIRKHDGTSEHRQWMFAGYGSRFRGGGSNLHVALFDKPRATFSTGPEDHIARLGRALRWFGEQTEVWLRNGITHPGESSLRPRL